MKLSSLLSPTKTVSINGANVVIKKYPMDFFVYQLLKDLEGRNKEQNDKGEIVNITGAGIFDLDLNVDRLYFGIEGWDITDDSGHVIEVTKLACLTLVNRAPEFAKLLAAEIQLFNQEAFVDSKKKS